VIGSEVVNLVIRLSDKRIKTAEANEAFIERGGVEADSSEDEPDNTMEDNN